MMATLLKRYLFYGGESLIEFNIIQDIVNYAKQKDSNIQFAMNTNLTLLTSKNVNIHNP